MCLYAIQDYFEMNQRELENFLPSYTHTLIR